MAAIMVRVAEGAQGKKIGLRYAASTLSTEIMATSLCVGKMPLFSFRPITSVPAPIEQVSPAVAMELFA